ncbi:glycosyltransferase family 39 protein, partial [bacterium]|nr:glycosyltransferase family 39 protein [bacterium]
MASAAREEPAATWSGRERAFVLGAVLVALVLRLLHWQSMAPYPWFDFLGLDAKYYDEWAQRLLAEGWLGKDPYFMGPLYPHLLAAIYAVAGHSLDAVRGVQMVLSAGTVAMMHVFVRPYGGPRLAGVASGMAAVYGPFVYYSTSILYPTLTVFLAVLLLHALLRAAERESTGWTIAAGATMGVFALGRGNILLFAPGAPGGPLIGPLPPKAFSGWHRR